MNAQLAHAMLNGASPGIVPYPRGTEISPVGECIAAHPVLAADLIAFEAAILLERVRMALDRDLSAATTAAGRLTALLASRHRDASGPALARGGLAPWQKRKIETHIGDHLDGPLLIQDLAKLVSLSSRHFCRAFKESFGQPPHSYIATTRIERARTLMLTTSDSLCQIAMACGLSDQAHFCRWFRQATGTTPGAWRRWHSMGPLSTA